MSIFTTYGDFRHNFGNPASLDVDGMRLFWAKSNLGKLYTARPFNSWDYDASLSPNGIKLTGAGNTIDLSISVSDPAGVDDAVLWTDEWHWYLSDPGSATGNPKWSLARSDGATSRSARASLTCTSAGFALYQSMLDFSGPSHAVSTIVRDVHLYALNIANEIVVWIDVHRCCFAPNSFTPSWPV